MPSFLAQRGQGRHLAVAEAVAPEDLVAKTAKTTIRLKTEDENPETPINAAAKIAEAERLSLVLTWLAEFGYVRPA